MAALISSPRRASSEASGAEDGGVSEPGEGPGWRRPFLSLIFPQSPPLQAVAELLRAHGGMTAEELNTAEK